MNNLDLKYLRKLKDKTIFFTIFTDFKYIFSYNFKYFNKFVQYENILVYLAIKEKWHFMHVVQYTVISHYILQCLDCCTKDSWLYDWLIIREKKIIFLSSLESQIGESQIGEVTVSQNTLPSQFSLSHIRDSLFLYVGWTNLSAWQIDQRLELPTN